MFYIIAFSVIGILGLVLAGWGSANKYGTLGGLRAAAQLVSYEIPIIMVAVAVAMLAQSLDLREIVAQQSSYPFVLVQPLGLVVFFIAGLGRSRDGRPSTYTSRSRKSWAGRLWSTAEPTGRFSS